VDDPVRGVGVQPDEMGAAVDECSDGSALNLVRRHHPDAGLDLPGGRRCRGRGRPPAHRSGGRCRALVDRCPRGGDGNDPAASMETPSGPTL
jgi:hypothetical protein